MRRACSLSDLSVSPPNRLLHVPIQGTLSLCAHVFEGLSNTDARKHSTEQCHFVNETVSRRYEQPSTKCHSRDKPLDLSFGTTPD